METSPLATTSSLPYRRHTAAALFSATAHPQCKHNTTTIS